MARSKSRTEKSSATSLEAASVAPVNPAAPAPRTSSSENGNSKATTKVVKSAAKSSVVPFSLEEEIRRRAYELYMQRGPNGSETDDWLVAEREILERYQEHRA